MPTAEEIRRRVEIADTARSAKRSAAAQQVGELAQRRAALAEQLADIERHLGDILAAARDVIEIEELARFTDVPAADLTRWLTARMTSRTKRKRPTASRSDVGGDTSEGPSPARPPTPNRAPTASEPAARRTAAADPATRIPAGTT